MWIFSYDRRVFDFIRRSRPSGRGELEISDVNTFYIGEGDCTTTSSTVGGDGRESVREPLRGGEKLIEEQRRACRFEPAPV